MSTAARTIFIDKTNYDVFDTLNPISLPSGMVQDTPENRANAALACVYSLARQLRSTQNDLDALKQSLKNRQSYKL